MTEHDISMEVEGLEELIESFEKVVKKYPDRAGDMLRKEGVKTRGRIVNYVRNDTDGDGSSKKSLKKLSSYSVSKPKGIGAAQYVEIKAKSPHFHLVDSGHLLVDKNKKPVGQGYVAGFHFKDRAVAKTRKEMPDDVEKMIDKILKEEGLT